MSSAYLFYWFEEKGVSFCPGEIRNFIENSNYPENDFKICYGTTDNFKKPLEEVIKDSEEVFIFPIFSATYEENKETTKTGTEAIEVLEKIDKLIAEYIKSGKLVHIFPLFFLKNSVLTKVLQSFIDTINNSSNNIKRIIAVSDKFRNNTALNLPIDWLVILRNFVDFIYSYRSSPDLKLNDMQGIVCFGSIALELPIRKSIDELLVRFFTAFKESQLRPGTSSFNFNLSQVTTSFELKIAEIFQGYQTPLANNPFTKEPEDFFYLVPEGTDEITESELQTESTTIVENLFRQIYDSVVKFSANSSLSVGELLGTFQKESLKKIKDTIVQFFDTGGSLYTLEKWCNDALENLAQSQKHETDLFKPKQIIENRRHLFVPKLKEFCRILLKLKYWQNFFSYKHVLLTIAVFLSLLFLIFAPDVMHFALTLKNTSVILIISTVLSLILTFIIMAIVRRYFREKAHKKLEELVSQFDKLRKELSDSLIEMFQNFTMHHFMAKIKIYIRNMLRDIQEICWTYRRVFERKETRPFSIGQSQLIKYCEGNAIPSEIEDKIKDDFYKNIRTIFVDFFNVSSEFEVESRIINCLQKIEEEKIIERRSSLKSADFNLKEGDPIKLIKQTEDHISCLVSPEIEKEKDVSVDRFFCLPHGIEVVIHGVRNLHSINWEKNESLLSIVIACNVKIGG
ncbi:MAG: hypothetical protein ACUVQP_01000 [Bacteroidales bacterium]